MEDGNESDFEGEEIPKFVVKVSHEAKLKELLRNITSIELKLCSDASKEYIKLLRGHAGGELLREYIQTSSKCVELLQAWKLRQGKPGLSYIVSLISAILSHPDGKYKPNNKEGNALSKALDKFARLIIEEKLGDLYKELNSKEVKRQNAALLLLASIVRRGSVLASEVGKSFDFKLPIFPNLAEYKRKQFEMKKKHSTRRSFVGFAMSFLEEGKPGLLRWVLQQKEMYSGILRGLGNDDDETVVYVLSTLRDRVLTPESLVPPGLRSVLFGSVTLDQLINISGRENGGLAAEIAHSVLVMAYMDEFPYNLEDHASPTWFAAVSVVANLVSSVGTGLSFDFLDSQPEDPLSFNNLDVQSIIKCISPRPFTRLVINKGLLHSDSLVKHGTLRLVLEVLKLLDSFIGAINSRFSLKLMASLQQDIQNEVRILLPDPQVLFSLLSSLNSHYKSPPLGLKRTADSEILLEHNVNGVKKLKTHTTSEDIDILVSGISFSPDIALPGDSGGVLGMNNVVDLDNGNDLVKAITDIWGLEQCPMPGMALKDLEAYFLSKLLDALKIYHWTMPTVLEGSFDFFKILPSNPLLLPTIVQQSLLSLLTEHIGWSPNCQIPIRTLPLMYKHLHPFINLLMYSPIKGIKDQAHVLAEAAMLSTGAFDKNRWEIGAWFLFLPGYNRDNSFVEEQGIEVFQNLSPSVVSFLCDVVSTVGNNLFKYWDLLRSHIYQLNGDKDVHLDFSPLVICVLEKCLRLLSSESGTFTLPEKSMISLYVCNTIRHLLQTQVESGLLSSLIDLLLSERLGDVYGDFCFLGDVAKLWPEMFSNGLKMVVEMIHGEGRNDDARRKPFQFSSQEEVISSIDIDSIESASVAFSLFLKQLPFYVLFPASVEYGEFSPLSTEELLNLVNGSLLGKTIDMLQYGFALSGDSKKLKKRLKLFDSVCPCTGEHDDLLDCDVNAIDTYSLNQSLNFVNRVIAKISLCRMLLFPEDNKIQSLLKEGDRDIKGMPSEVESSGEDWSRNRFINTLVHTWQFIVKKFPLISADSGEMSNVLIQLQSLPFLEQLARSSFLHRFEDPTTLKFLRKILTSLSEGKFSCILLLQLLVAHSQFAPSIRSVPKSSGCSEVGVIFRPMSSILRSLIIPCTARNALDDKDNPQPSDCFMKQLEVIKLLRILFHFKPNQWDIGSERDIGINSRELLFLLLSSYGATLSEIDLEIYNLMHAIESTDESNSGNIAEMDYLWGSAALRIRKELGTGAGCVN
ncbi:hypothetical protein F0562_031914 [Nyssa sinensis]|uniref:URB1 N-terminal domain-containing protein n=1 Tax=Nyssa sinensis TaxID=561372 RepID=A0A5J5AY71_9ASTE|nr:hypothetical protein F0562_031914 [Nyssa sinensis]